jgi:mannosidase alpha-like ER degradation enhancer 1
MFHHGFTGYMEYAYPADELRPTSCKPLWRDPDASNIGVNDIHANVSMTLIDSLSALLLILPDQWPDAVERVATRVSFDQDVKVQVSCGNVVGTRSDGMSCCAASSSLASA